MAEDSNGAPKAPGASTRFQKGFTGNAKGRPKKKLGPDASVLRAALEPVVVREDGKRTRKSKYEVGATQLVNKHAAGDLRATKMVMEALRRHELSEHDSEGDSQLSRNDEAIAQRVIKRIREGDDD